MADPLSLTITYAGGVKFVHDVLHSREVENMFSIMGYRSKLEDLRKVVSLLKPFVTKTVRTHVLRVQHSDAIQMQHLIDELRDVVFDAEDLFDLQITVDEIKRHHDGDNLYTKLRDFFSYPNWPLVRAHYISAQIDDINKKLDAIAAAGQVIGNNIVLEPIIEHVRAQTDSLQGEHFVGRNSDLASILGKLFNDASYVPYPKCVSFVTIVGVGGVGKTALARQVFNDDRVKKAFELRVWAHISDLDQTYHVDGRNFLCKIYDSLLSTDRSHHSHLLNLEQLQTKVQNHLGSKKFLLVLDDIWIENPFKWEINYKKYINSGKKGSRVLVTTRSHKTATIISGSSSTKTHFVHQLSFDNSLRLLEKVSQPPPNSQEVMLIAKEIVKSCAGIPLAISVVGSFLRRKDLDGWQRFQKHGLAMFLQNPQADIMSVLMWSYLNLEPPLQSCFSYCALFPKGTELRKSNLLSLWMAQGYVVPLWDGQSLNDAAEEYFSILLQRGLFQDKREIYGEVYSCKMHNLIHDLAQTVSKKEIFTTNTTINGILDRNVRHVSFTTSEIATYSFKKSPIRSFLHVGTRHHSQRTNMNQAAVKALVANCMQLRALDLNWSEVKILPKSICNLLHLRYLNLSHNEDLEVLPGSITKLYNLQTLILTGCKKLKGLPKNLVRLVNLRVLGIGLCMNLKGMPLGMGKLTCLHSLSDFKMGSVEGTGFGWNQWFDGMEDLMALNNLSGSLAIEIRWPKKEGLDAEEDGRESGSYLSNKEQLKWIEFSFMETNDDNPINDEDIIRLTEKLKPHENLRFLNFGRYNGSKMPNWATQLPNLVKVNIYLMDELTYLPCLGKLKCLKFLKISHMKNLEYIQIGDCFSDVSFFFSSLEKLTLENLPKLEGWKKEVRFGDQQQQQAGSSNSEATLCLPQVKKLCILSCPELTCIPTCRKVESLRFHASNQRLQILDTADKSLDEVPKLVSVSTDNVEWVYNSLPKESYQDLERLEIEDKNMLSFGLKAGLCSAKEVMLSCSISLKYLKICYCHDLDSFVEFVLQYLTALEELLLEWCEEVNPGYMFEDCFGLEIFLSSINLCLDSLHTLTLRKVTVNETLPSWMQHLSTLNHLYIDECLLLMYMPDWMPNLKSLKKLEVTNCLKTPFNGLNWNLIQHIPEIKFESCYDDPCSLLEQSSPLCGIQNVFNTLIDHHSIFTYIARAQCNNSLSAYWSSTYAGGREETMATELQVIFRSMGEDLSRCVHWSDYGTEIQEQWSDYETEIQEGLSCSLPILGDDDSMDG